MFDQVMLVSRLEEEKDILLCEMTQHCRNLQRKVEELQTVIDTGSHLSK